MDAIAGLLQNPVVLLVLGLLVKYFPPLAKVPNALIPYLNTLMAFLGAMAGPKDAHAAGLGVVCLGFGAFSFLGPVAGAVWSSVQSSLLHEFFLRHPLKSAGFQAAR